MARREVTKSHLKEAMDPPFFRNAKNGEVVKHSVSLRCEVKMSWIRDQPIFCLSGTLMRTATNPSVDFGPSVGHQLGRGSDRPVYLGRGAKRKKKSADFWTLTVRGSDENLTLSSYIIAHQTFPENIAVFSALA
jgi:hypothetical protein